VPTTTVQEMRRRRGESLDGARCRASALVALARLAAPRVVPSNRNLDEWLVFVPATVLRCAYLVESILALEERHLDAGILLRSLFEHIVTFAWLAIDPSGRMPRIVAADYKSRMKMHEHFERVGRPGMLPEHVVQEMSAYVLAVEAGLAGNSPASDKQRLRLLPQLDRMAEEADKYWNGRTALDLQGTESLSGQYALYFRNYSHFVHSTSFGVQPFVSGGVRHAVALSPYPHNSEDFASVGAAAVLFGSLILFVTSDYGWPEAEAVNEIFDRYPD
jgi:hypothetical protein